MSTPVPYSGRCLVLSWPVVPAAGQGCALCCAPGLSPEPGAPPISYPLRPGGSQWNCLVRASTSGGGCLPWWRWSARRLPSDGSPTASRRLAAPTATSMLARAWSASKRMHGDILVAVRQHGCVPRYRLLCVASYVRVTGIKQVSSGIQVPSVNQIDVNPARLPS